MSSNYTVYMHVFPNGKKYIGITGQPLNKRFGSNGIGYKRCPKVYKAIKKYGWENVEHIVLAEGLAKEEAEEIEIKLIKKHNTTVEGYNIEHGGNTTGTHSEETKRKISKANKGKKRPPVSEERREKQRQFMLENNPFKGKHLSEEQKRKHSEFMKGNRNAKGLKHTDEFKAWKSIQMHNAYKDGGNPRCKEVVRIDEDGMETVFFSLREAARNTKLSPAAMCKRLKDGKERDGYKWRYQYETR